jgi:hypothetical protein
MFAAILDAELSVLYAIGVSTSIPTPMMAALNTTQSTVTAPVSSWQNLKTIFFIIYFLSGSILSLRATPPSPVDLIQKCGQIWDQSSLYRGN